MKISVDAGAVSKKGNLSGNYTFSFNLIKNLKKYDKKNQYYFYYLDDYPIKFGFLKFWISFKELKEKKDVFLALNQSVPLYHSKKVINFSHGLSFYFFPQCYPKDYNRLKNQLKEMIVKSDYIIVSSVKVKEEFLSIDEKLEKKIIVIPFGLDHIDVSFQKEKKPYFLFVGNELPIKNISLVKKIFYKIQKEKKFKDFKLYLLTKNIPLSKIKKYYRQAYALITTSFYESFNFPVGEALVSGCPVVGLSSAIIPEFQPYVNLSTNEKELIEKLIKLPKKPTKKIIEKIKKKFSWKKYVEKLIKLY